jgi:hypothetical protein
VASIEPTVLLAIADGLALKSAREFADLVDRNRRPLRFKIFACGIGKTGTLSISAVFGRYRSAHQFMMHETLEEIRRRERGETDEEALRAFLLERDTAGGLELDSSGHHFAYLDLLVDAFPGARFLFTIRDCYSWFESVVGQISLPRGGFDSPGPFDFDAMKEACRDRERLLAELDDWLDGPLAYWAWANGKALDAMPQERSLVVRTHEISQRLDRMAGLAAVDVATLYGGRSHADVLRSTDPDRLRGPFSDHCSALMEAFFPGYALEDYLAGRPIPPHPDLSP